MSQSELSEHRNYLADDRRTMAYRAALAEVVHAGDVVLDLGSGTGILGHLACEAGAGSVIAVERGEITALTRRIAADNGLGEKVHHHHARSTEIALDRLADVVVCDQIGGLVHDAGILRFFADARKRLSSPGATLVPASFRIYLAPACFDEGREAVEFWSSRPGNIDVSAARVFAVNTEWHYARVAGSFPLADGAGIAEFSSDHDEPISGKATFTIHTKGRMDGLMGWFDAQMSPSVRLSNDPWSPERFDRWCNFYPIESSVDLTPGDRVEVSLEIRPKLNLVAWDITVRPEGGQAQRFRHSTLTGTFVTRASFDRRTEEKAPVPSGRVEIVREVLAFIDGSRSRADIVQALAGRVGTDFSTEAQLDRFVGNCIELTRALT